MASNGSNKTLAEVVSKFIFGMGAGILADGFVEVTKFPILNEAGMFGNTISNFETLSYAIVAGGISTGLIDLFTSNTILGFSKNLMPFLAGYGVGIQQYELWIAEKLGVRGFDIYNTAGSLIPKLG